MCSTSASNPPQWPAAPSRPPPPPPPPPPPTLDIITERFENSTAEDTNFTIQRKPVPALIEDCRRRRVASEGSAQSRVRAIVNRFEQPGVTTKTIPPTRRLTGMGMAFQQRTTSTSLGTLQNKSKRTASVETKQPTAMDGDPAIVFRESGSSTSSAAVKDVRAKEKTTFVGNFDAEAYIRAAKATVEQAKLRTAGYRPDKAKLGAQHTRANLDKAVIRCDPVGVASHHESICSASSTAASFASVSSKNSTTPTMILSLDGTPIETAAAVVPAELDRPPTLPLGKSSRGGILEAESASTSSTYSQDAEADEPESRRQDGAAGGGDSGQTSQQQVPRESPPKQRNSRNLTIATTAPQYATSRYNLGAARGTVHARQSDSLRLASSTTATIATSLLHASLQTRTPTVAVIKQAATAYTFLFSPTDEASSSQQATPLPPFSAVSSTTAFSFESISPASPGSLRSACSLHRSSPTKSTPSAPAPASSVDNDTTAPSWMGSRTDSSGSSVVLNTLYDRTLEEDSLEVLRYRQFFHQPLGRCLDGTADGDADIEALKRLSVTIAEMGDEYSREGDRGLGQTDTRCDIAHRKRAMTQVYGSCIDLPRNGDFEQSHGFASASVEAF